MLSITLPQWIFFGIILAAMIAFLWTLLKTGANSESPMKPVKKAEPQIEEFEEDFRN